VDSQEVDRGMSRCWARRWGFAKIRSAQTPPRNRRTTEKHHSARGRRRHGGGARVPWRLLWWTVCTQQQRGQSSLTAGRTSDAGSNPSKPSIS
jgi:hypothetical protein